jgi:ATP-dependent DNA helicase RecQ
LPYHAGLSSDQRKINQSIFMKEPGIVMTATIAFGMGIDKPDVRYVFHVNLPGNMEAYYQELGRAGRDGAPAEAIMLYGLDDIRQRRIFIEDANDDEDHKRREHKRLDALISYCETPLCRRRVLLTYFAEDTEACGNCDICIDPPNLFDGSVPAKLVLSAIKQTGERFGATHVTDVLLGADTRKIRDFGHNRLPVYGQGLDEDKNTWRSILRQLVAAGYLHLDISGYGGLNLTPYGRSFLEDGGEFRFRRDVLPMKSKIARSEGKVISKHSDLTEADADLFAALKGLRLDIANDRGVPAYVIFSDRSLVDMTLKKPANDIAFAGIFGVGKAKLRDFCMPFLAVIAEFK